MTRTIYREYIPSTDPRCRRHIHHDSHSKLYPYPSEGLAVGDVNHERVLPILDQGQVGSCTSEAGLGTLGTVPFYTATVAAAYARVYGSFDQTGAYRMYSAEESLDGDGPYPPNDNGSTGITCAKVLQSAGLISGYQHTFSLDDALKALTRTPLITGTNWYNSMFTPSADGVVTVDPGSGLAGGHEYEVVGYDTTRGLVRFANSWGAGWGAAGYFYLQAEDWGTLLGQQGDVTVFVPLTQPAPTPPAPPPSPSPVPPSDADLRLAHAAQHWLREPHVLRENRTMAEALHVWLLAHGFSAVG